MITALLFISINSCKNETDDDPASINVELQKLELEIYQKIDEGDKSGALKLLKELNHPSNEPWTEKQKMTEWDHAIDGGNLYYTYNEWWTIRRDSIRNIVLGIASESKSNSKRSRKNKQEEVEETQEPEISEPEVSSISISSNLYGLYIYQLDNGSTKFYKILKNNKGGTGVVYQDNITGNVKIENYDIISFNENSMEITLQSKKNANEQISLSFERDSESENGYKLTDREGTTYNYIR